MVPIAIELIANKLNACNIEQAACLGQQVAESSSSHARCVNRLTEGWWTICLTYCRKISQESCHACLQHAIQQYQ